MDNDQWVSNMEFFQFVLSGSFSECCPKKKGWIHLSLFPLLRCYGNGDDPSAAQDGEALQWVHSGWT